jgi:hypothetical protein
MWKPVSRLVVFGFSGVFLWFPAAGLAKSIGAKIVKVEPSGGGTSIISIDRGSNDGINARCEVKLTMPVITVNEKGRGTFPTPFHGIAFDSMYASVKMANGKLRHGFWKFSMDYASGLVTFELREGGKVDLTSVVIIRVDSTVSALADKTAKIEVPAGPSVWKSFKSLAL